MVEEVLKKYPKDVNFAYKNYPLPATMHPQAMPAAKASVAAGKQGKFWEMHDIIFKNISALGNDKYKQFASEIGLDVARFEKDMESPEVQAIVNKDSSDGRAADVTGTPTFFVNGKRVSNRSVEGFSQMIDEALKEKS